MTDSAHDHAHPKDNSLDRLLFFSDGVFAIAITLLSIELHPPHDWDGTAAQLLRQGWPGFAAYALSFLVIGIFWTSHRRMFTQIRRFTTGVFLLNLLLLGLIALMPFMTNLLYIDGPRGEAFLIYLGVVSAAGLVQGAMLAWAVFVNHAVDPAVHVSRRVTAILSAGLLPGLISAGSMLMFGVVGGGVELWLPAVCFAMAVVILLARGLAEKRYR
ncbi:TMEM175 family protein [Brevundimonas subvibrioides]|uniref:TMEM175 family protein n=1 Tax=Brevundimonas subvibrioides TaxID=74313 RepID=UPI0022B4A22D|nr:TMEM175 family protein [Brevundimonas subvibrioides]